MARSSNDDEDFWEDKLLIDPNEAYFWDLIFLLCSSNIKNRRFIDCLENDCRRAFERRWLIFTSVVAQIILLSLKDPLYFIGDALMFWSNLLALNGGFFKLVWRFAKGYVEWPNKSSKKYETAVGLLDWRVDLDGNMRPGHRTYNAMLSLMSSKLSYENHAVIESVVKDHWHMELLGSFRFWNEYLNRKSTGVLMVQDMKSDPNTIVVAFKGTSPFDAYDWCTDVDLSWYQLEGIGKIHRGFMKALGLQKNGWPKTLEDQNGQQEHLYAYYEIRKLLKEKLQRDEKAKFILTGHSLGGALAILYVFILALHEETWLLQKLDGVYTFGQPRVGDKQFREFMQDALRKYNVKYLRYVYSNDVVPRLPYDDATFLYKHIGPCIFYNSCYKAKILQEEPNKNYFNILWVLPKIANAVWELIRSFIIPYTKGPVYRESWFMKAFRVVGLVFPGLSAHAPQDYDNCTRLGSLPLSSRLQEGQL